jgi:hypothetical protein
MLAVVNGDEQDNNIYGVLNVRCRIAIRLPAFIYECRNAKNVGDGH